MKTYEILNLSENYFVYPSVSEVREGETPIQAIDREHGLSAHEWEVLREVTVHEPDWLDDALTHGNTERGFFTVQTDEGYTDFFLTGEQRRAVFLALAALDTSE